LILLISRQEEEGTEADLLDVQADKHVRNGLWEELAARVALHRLVDDPDEKILEDDVRKERECRSEPVDNRRNHHIRED